MKLQIFMKGNSQVRLKLAAIRWDTALKKDDNYYPQVFLKACYVHRKKMYLGISMII